jgi:hypothetical protein
MSVTDSVVASYRVALRLSATDASCLLPPRPSPFEHEYPSGFAYSVYLQYLLTLKFDNLPTRAFSSAPLAACSFTLKESCSHNCVRRTLSSAGTSARSVCTRVSSSGSSSAARRPRRYVVCLCSLVVDPRSRHGAQRCWATAAVCRRPVWAHSAWRRARLATRSARRRLVTAAPRPVRLSPSPAPPAAACRPARRV